MKNLWGGRFSQSMDELVKHYNASISFDQSLYAYDIRGSAAHVRMLGEQGIVSESESAQIIAALDDILRGIEAGEVTFTVDDEDIHMGVERHLIERIQETGKKLHTARSRNDQSALDVKMYLKDRILDIVGQLLLFERALLSLAEKNTTTLMPAFTHLQHAQPVTAAFHLMAYFQQIKRDIGRFLDCYERTDYCPLGACAVAGTTLPINRQRTAQLLGFKHVTENAMDTVSDRDHILEFLSAAAICMSHLSRFAEEIILWNSQEFGYVNIADSFCTGSSIMPQKKNPDIAELIRGKSGRVIGHLMALHMVLKGTPMSFNKDFQEDKEALFDAVKTLHDSVTIFAKMLECMSFKPKSIARHLTAGYLNATDIAEYFVTQGIPFRQAHEMTGALVKYCEANDMTFEQMTDELFKSLEIPLDAHIMAGLSIGASVEKRSSYGGTASVEVHRQINAGKEAVEAFENILKGLR